MAWYWDWDAKVSKTFGYDVGPQFARPPHDVGHILIAKLPIARYPALAEGRLDAPTQGTVRPNLYRC
jgi:hypothetical protein